MVERTQPALAVWLSSWHVNRVLLGDAAVLPMQGDHGLHVCARGLHACVLVSQGPKLGPGQ